MSINVSVGISQGEDSYAVGANACQDALDRLGGAIPDLCIVFSSVKYDQRKMLEGVRSVADGALLVGSSTAGEITNEGPARRQSVAVMVVASDTAKFFGAVGQNVAAGARAAGRAAGEGLIRAAGGKTLRSCILFSDVLAGSGTEVVRGIGDALGDSVTVVGGSSGDDFRFTRTYQYFGGKAYSGAVVALGLSGPVVLGSAIRHGWIPVGVPMKVTKAEGRVVGELDGRPAIRIYEEYLGKEMAQELQSEPLAKLAILYPLGMRIEGFDEFLIRDPLRVDGAGAITCTAEIPVGSEVRLMIGSREDAIAVAREAAESALRNLGGARLAAAIVFDSIARKRLLGEDAGKEIAGILDVIGKGIPLVGSYAYGEAGPIGAGTDAAGPFFHNEAVLVCLLGE